MEEYMSVKDSWVTDNNILYWLAAISGIIIFIIKKDIVVTFGSLFFIVAPIYLIMLVVSAYKLRMLNLKTVRIPENITFERLCSYLKQNFEHPDIYVDFSRDMITFTGLISKHQLTFNNKGEIVIQNKSTCGAKLKHSSLNNNVQAVYRDTLHVLPLIYQAISDAKAAFSD